MAFKILLAYLSLLTIIYALKDGEILNRKTANTFIKHRSRRSLRGGLIQECCSRPPCNFEERAEYSEDHGWNSVDHTLCDVSIIDDRNCQCKARAGWNYRCGSLDGFCRKKACTCNDGSKENGWEMTNIVYHHSQGKVDIKKQKASGGDHYSDGRGTSDGTASSYTESTSFTETESFTRTSGSSIAIGRSFTVGVPEVASGTVTSEITTSQSRTFGKTTQHAKTITKQLNCPRQNGKFIICRPIETISYITVPYTMTMRHKVFGCTCNSDGVYKSERLSSLHFQIIFPDKIPEAYGKRK